MTVQGQRSFLPNPQPRLEIVKPMVLEVYAALYGGLRAQTMLQKTLTPIAAFVIDQADAGLPQAIVHTQKDGTEHCLPSEDILNALAPIRNTKGA